MTPDWTALAEAFGLADARPLPQLKLCGSPERCAARMAVSGRDADGQERTLILEVLAPGQFGRRGAIAVYLGQLAAAGLTPLAPYLPGPEGTYIRDVDGVPCMAQPYVPSEELDRPGYLRTAWRGEALGNFLAELRRASEGIEPPAHDPSSELPLYIPLLVSTILEREPEVAPALAPVLHQLESFLGRWDSLPLAAAHGDLHPVNVLWGGDHIRAVIDWEFTTLRPEGYDLANALSCMGFEDPRGLGGECALGLVRAVRGAGLLAERSWETLPDLVLALRFAWLSEWLRRDDREMLGLELDYMALLARNRERLLALWG